ncbi:MAG: polyvinylalcohol dehydrogenase [Planctomycetes bacterium]|nr:polyvinylalcohol dehydrogenase [Planctomycetota bacterium]
MHRFVAALVFVLAVAVTLSAADWPTFRGADRSGVSTEKGLLKAWPKDGPALAWKATSLGKGYSSVAIMGDKVYTLGDIADGCYLFAIDRANGKEKWKLKMTGTGGGGGFEGPRCTPSTDGEFVYALSPGGELVCASAKDGSKKWAKSLKKDFGGSCGGWAYCESPLIDGPNLIVTPGGKSAMVALNKKTGETVWTGALERAEEAGYASIAVGTFGDVKQYVTLMSNGLASFDAKTGKLLWRYGTGGDRFGRNTANIPTPIINGDLVFASAGYGRGAALLKIKKGGEKYDIEELYWNGELTNKHGGVVLMGERLYGDRDDSGRPWCADFKTGKVLWSREGRTNGGGSASLTAADGKVFVRYSDGWVVMLDANAQKYTELGSFKVPNGRNNTWAHPVVLDGKLYVRELDTLWVYNVKGK